MQLMLTPISALSLWLSLSINGNILAAAGKQEIKKQVKKVMIKKKNVTNIAPLINGNIPADTTHHTHTHPDSFCCNPKPYTLNPKP